MGHRKPQINFQVNEPMKRLYEEAKLLAHGVTRFCAAGLLLMIEDPQIRRRALNRLRDWESEYERASPEQIRAFVQGAEAALERGAPESRPGPKARRSRKAARHT